MSEDHRTTMEHVKVKVAHETPQSADEALTPGASCSEDEDDGPHEVAGIQESKKETAAELTDNAHEGVLDITKSATGVTKAATGKILHFTSRQHGYEGEKVTAVIQERGGKASGIHKNWWNIVYESPDSCAGNEDCVDISKLDDVSIQSDRETVLLSVPDEFQGAKVDELRSWVKNEVYTEIQDA